MDFPQPPPSLDDKASDILKRVGEFLPKIEQANQDLDGSNYVQLDATLVEDKNEDEESDEESSIDEAQADSVPTIELKVALGSLDENPAIAMLAGDSDDDNYDEATEKEKQEGNTDNRRKATRTLREAGVAEAPNAKARDENTKKRKVLVEELS